LAQPLNIDEYRKIYLDVKIGRHARLTTSAPPVSRMSRHGGILGIPEPYRAPASLTGTQLHLTMNKKMYRVVFICQGVPRRVISTVKDVSELLKMIVYFKKLNDITPA
jgi:hypothetical protein